MTINPRLLALALPFVLVSLFVGCSDDDDDNKMMPPSGTDPDTAPVVAVDRFSDDAATLMRRSANPDLPGPNVAINYDFGEPFITRGLGPDGEETQYYNFDVQNRTPAPIYVLFKEGESTPVSGQLNVIDDLPGDADYSDFWRVNKVTVPGDYVANTVTSFQDIDDAGYMIEQTDNIVNCPVVPEGSTASLRIGGGSSALTRGWYQDSVVFYFSFEEHALTATNGMVPLSGIYVTFNTNGDPSTGFVTESGSAQTHNVLQTLPADNGYSPLWAVSVYDNADFAMVHNWQTAIASTFLGAGPNVNCPVVSVGSRHPVDPMTAPLASVDRFSDAAGTLMQRSGNPSLPGPNMPINFDSGEPFITRGLSPAGESIRYYNFDVQSTTPAPIYVLVDGNGDPISGQLNIIDVLPGDAGYNDFWNVNFVTVPDGYQANSITSADQIFADGLSIQGTDVIVNCPLVPDGSTASLRGGSEPNTLHSGWYDGHVVKYFTFEEAAIAASGGMVPLSAIYVTFNTNGDPSTGFVTEDGTDQTHNVVQTIPTDGGYSPLWAVSVYDNADFGSVSDWDSALSAGFLGAGPNVNCPVVDF